MYPALPNHLTWARIVAIPIFIGIFYLPDDWLGLQQKNLLSTVLFVGAAVTDLLDGYIARRYQLTTPFGAFLDPVADKLIGTKIRERFFPFITRSLSRHRCRRNTSLIEFFRHEFRMGHRNTKSKGSNG